MGKERFIKHSFEYYLLAATFLAEDGLIEEASMVIDHINAVWPDRGTNCPDHGSIPNISDEEL